jgi:hypothetical protein
LDFPSNTKRIFRGSCELGQQLLSHKQRIDSDKKREGHKSKGKYKRRDVSKI